MTTKRNNPYSDNHQQYDDVKYALYCDALEEQYKKAKEEGLFEVLKILELDKEHSDSTLVQAIDYFNEKNGLVEKDAPMDFLTEREKKWFIEIRDFAQIFTACFYHKAFLKPFITNRYFYSIH
jgi:hypothetical protein